MQLVNHNPAYQMTYVVTESKTPMKCGYMQGHAFRDHADTKTTPYLRWELALLPLP